MNEPKKIKILAVDDDPQILSFLKKRFKSFGYLCETAENGKEGLETAIS